MKSHAYPHFEPLAHPFIKHRDHSSHFHGSRQDGDFQCKKCQIYVTSNPLVSGVLNRNHCPCCLWSRHVDLFQPGDRLSACKSLMKPIGLTLKRTRNKYGSEAGEIMLVHQCQACSFISINRIAADDVPQNILQVLNDSRNINILLLDDLMTRGIYLLKPVDSRLVHTRLFGNE